MKTIQTLLFASLFAPAVVNALPPALEVRTNYLSGPSQTNQFNTNSGYLRQGSSLDGQPTNAPSADQWQTTDQYNAGTDRGSTSLVNYINNYSPLLSGSGNNSVYYGGYNSDSGILPGITNPSLYYSFTQPGVFASPVLLKSSTFTVDFAIIGPSSDVSAGFTNRDYFGFSLLNTAGTSTLAEFVFNPFTGTSTNLLRFQWVQNGTNAVTNGSTYKGFQIEYDALYRLTATITNSQLFLDIAGLQTQSQPGVGITNYAVVTNQNIISGGALSGGLTTSDFGRVSLDWELSSGNINTPGANYMIMTAASIISQAVPEPGTWAMGALLLGGVVVLIARRRAASRVDQSVKV
jgi:hypothetical protein